MQLGTTLQKKLLPSPFISMKMGAAGSFEILLSIHQIV
jgi:hypothetical protein